MTISWDLLLYILEIFTLVLLLRIYLKNNKIENNFTSIINHTFRTPLTRINWTSKELENIDITKEERISHIQNIRNAADRLIQVIDLIVGARDIKKADKYLMRKVSFREIVESSIDKYRDNIKNKNINFKISSFEDIPLLVVDTSKISFVVDTLIENAIVYTPKGGSILIDCNFKRNKILFYVADSGIGLSPLDKIRLFSKFYRSKRASLSYPDGVGLRLYLSKEIIKGHRGKIYAKSSGEGKGSIFFVKLPVVK